MRRLKDILFMHRTNSKDEEAPSDQRNVVAIRRLEVVSDRLDIQVKRLTDQVNRLSEPEGNTS